MTNPHRGEDQAQMSFGQHLDELRKRLIFALLGLGAAACVTLFFGRAIVAWLCQPLIDAQRLAAVPEQTYVLTPLAGFAVYLKVSLVAAAVLSAPWIIYQFWKFIESGLYSRERLTVLLLTPFSAVMLLAALAFLYYLLLPVCLWFLISFSTGYPPPAAAEHRPLLHLLTAAAPGPDAADPAQLNGAMPVVIPVVAQPPPGPVNGQLWLKMPEKQLHLHLAGQTRIVPMAAASLVAPLIDVGSYISFVLAMAVGVAVAFQLPVVMTILGWAGWARADQLAAYRRHCIFTCFALAMFLTPADILSMFMLGLPLWGLFELGLLTMRFTPRRRPEPSHTD